MGDDVWGAQLRDECAVCGGGGETERGDLLADRKETPTEEGDKMLV